MNAQRAKIYDLVLFNNIFFQLFWGSFGSFFFVFPSRRLSVTFDIQALEDFGSKFRSIFRTLSNIQDRGFCTKSERLLGFDYFCKKLQLRCLARFWVCLYSQLRLRGKSSFSNVWHGFEFASNYLYKPLSISCFRKIDGYLFSKFD